MRLLSIWEVMSLKYVSGVNLVIDGGYSKTNPSASVVMQNYI